MALTLLGDVFLGTFLTLIADRIGRRKVLFGGSVLMILSGVVFAIFENFWILLLAAILGVISVTGGDFGPFRSIEESVLSQLTDTKTRSDVLAWYVTTSALGSSIGSEVSGRIIHFLQDRDGWTAVDAYHALFWIYTAMGFVNALLVVALSDACELQRDESYSVLPQEETDGTEEQQRGIGMEAPLAKNQHWYGKSASWFTSHLTRISVQTRVVMYKLWFLLSIDSLADGMVPYSLTNYYMDKKFHPLKSTLGDVTSVSYFLSAIGAVFAGPLAHKIGLINTMVFTHVPSSASVLIFPFAGKFWITAALLLVRTGLNNMDQAPRSAFIAAVVKPEERTAVMGITSMIRTLAAMAGPTLTGFLAASEQFWIAFVVAGLCRLAYDFGLYLMFVNMEVQGQAHKPENGRNQSHPSDEEIGLEMESLADTDDEKVDSADGHLTTHHTASSSAVHLPAPLERSRSRSPLRQMSSDAG